MSEKRAADLTDAQVQDILVQSMADAGYDPAFVYAFRKTGVYVCEENESSLPKSSLQAFRCGGRRVLRVGLRTGSITCSPSRHFTSIEGVERLAVRVEAGSMMATPEQ